MLMQTGKKIDQYDMVTIVTHGFTLFNISAVIKSLRTRKRPIKLHVHRGEELDESRTTDMAHFELYGYTPWSRGCKIFHAQLI